MVDIIAASSSFRKITAVACLLRTRKAISLQVLCMFIGCSKEGIVKENFLKEKKRIT